MNRLPAALVCLAMLISCGTSGGIDDTALSAIELATLRCNLYGEWQEQQPPGGEVVGGQAWRWLFFDDGSGVRAPVARNSPERARAFLWSLEGAELRVSFGGSDGTIYRRMEAWDAEQISWYDYQIGREKLLLRRSVGRRPARCETLLATSQPESF
jgi:hypothetical protein